MIEEGARFEIVASGDCEKGVGNEPYRVAFFTLKLCTCITLIKKNNNVPQGFIVNAQA